jgi:hypothetical protein
MRKPESTNYIDNLKKGLEGIPETEREELKHEKIDEDFGLLELAANAGRDAQKRTGILYIVHSICNTGGQLGFDRIRLMARMASQQLRLCTNRGEKNINFRFIKRQER